MAFQEIQKVTETEQETRAKKAEAQAEAKRIIAAAEKEGVAAADELRAQAEAQARELMTQAEALAGEESERTLAANAEACKAMRAKAETRLEQAADLIVRRVVNL